MNGEIVIREATQPSTQLCDGINRLLRDLTSTPKEMDMARLTALLAWPGTHLYMAYESGRDCPVGMFSLATTMMTTGCNVWLEDVVIAQNHQGRGFGKTLVACAIERARAICPGGRLVLTSRPSRLAANHIYSDLFVRKETNVYCLQL